MEEEEVRSMAMEASWTSLYLFYFYFYFFYLVELLLFFEFGRHVVRY